MHKILIALSLCIIGAKTIAQPIENADLYKLILKQDSLLFDVGFNTCNIQQFENLLSDSLRFYHDKDGFSDKAKFLQGLKSGLCNNPQARQVKRVLLKESMEVYTLYKSGNLYGAIQQGAHLFYENGEAVPGIAKFTNLWLLEQGSWKLASSLSYDHKAY